MSADPAFHAMRQSLVERGLVDGEFRLTEAGHNHAAALIADIERRSPRSPVVAEYVRSEEPCRDQWATRAMNTPLGPTSDGQGPAPFIASGGEPPKVMQPCEASTSPSSTARRFGFGPTGSPTTMEKTQRGLSSEASETTSGETCRDYGASTLNEKNLAPCATKSEGSNGRPTVEILTTRDLRRFLAEVMVDVRSGKVKPHEAQAIAKLSSQINQSLSIEVNAALRQGMERGAYVDVEPLKIANQAIEDGNVWCDQCDGQVSIEDARNCKSQHCSVRKAA